MKNLFRLQQSWITIWLTFAINLFVGHHVGYYGRINDWNIFGVIFVALSIGLWNYIILSQIEGLFIGADEEKD